MKEGRIFYLMAHTTHCIYGYMVSDISLRIVQVMRKEINCCHNFLLTARNLLYIPSHRLDSTCHDLFSSNVGALVGMRNITNCDSFCFSCFEQMYSHCS